MTLKRSGIGWCDFSGGNLNVVIRGRNCPVSEGCTHCYVERWYKRWGREMPEGTTVYPDKLGRLWKAEWPEDGHRRGPGSKPVLFLADLGDLFCEDVDDDFILAAFDMMHIWDDADWVVLTKRAERMYSVITRWLDIRETEIGEVPSHIWLLVSAENQKRLDERVPWLLRIPAAVRGVSLEPMLEPMSLTRYLVNNSLYKAERYAGRFHFHGEQQRDGSVVAVCDDGTRFYDGVDLHWVIVGAESGKDRRPFKVKWVLDAYEQCRAAGIPFFGKQDSGLRPGVPLVLPGYGEVKEWPR